MSQHVERGAYLESSLDYRDRHQDEADTRASENAGQEVTRGRKSGRRSGNQERVLLLLLGQDVEGSHGVSELGEAEEIGRDTRHVS